MAFCLPMRLLRVWAMMSWNRGEDHRDSVTGGALFTPHFFHINAILIQDSGDDSFLELSKTISSNIFLFKDG